MYYGSGTVDKIASGQTADKLGPEQTLRVNSPGGSTFFCEMASWPPSWKCDVLSEIRLLQSVRIYFNPWYAYLLEEQSWQNFIPIRFVMTEPEAFWWGRPKQKEEQQDV